MTQKDWILYGIVGFVAYWLYSRSTTHPSTYPPVGTGRQPTGSGGVTAGGGMSNPLPGGRVGGGGTPTGSGGVTADDPCDPLSPSYDPSMCGSVTLGPPDTMDPCDPNSTMYDPGQCGTPVTQMPVDTFDVCDPNSSMYDPVACSGTYSSWDSGGGGGDFTGGGEFPDELDSIG